MNSTLNRKCHAVAGQLSEDPHQLLRQQARLLGLESWSQVTDRQARQILRDLEQAAAAGGELVATARPGLSTKQQRMKISAIRHANGWSWKYIKALVKEYGVDDWQQLTQEDADNLIQRLGQIAKNMKRRSEQEATSHTA